MLLQEHIPVGTKTTMKIGGSARWYAELLTKADAEEAQRFAREKNVPLIVLGGGANTVFADGTIDALVVRIKADAVRIDGRNVVAEAGTILASLINTCAEHELDLSALTGIPGTVGGALFGNAGQGPKGTWLDSFVTSVTALVDGEWKTFSKDECDFRYRESAFKQMPDVVLWETNLIFPSRPETKIKADIERLIKRRFETQPHLKTAGSCFKAVGDGTPAWQLIEKAGLRGFKIGGVQVSEKHANFLLNVDKATFADVLAVTQKICEAVPQIEGIEMRLYGEDGKVVRS
ncbi:MAG: FAD-binding protein [Candidatus Peribacteraceae bacterium]|nr:FAD-binding protein [Candidatus Peribacteraceae bacterium]